MIKIENVGVCGFEVAIRGMRNPMNSWKKSDSKWCYENQRNKSQCSQIVCDDCVKPFYEIGENDLALMKSLVKAGPDHRKFLRMINISMDITAPLYWWKEYDTYKIGTVTNSCSTMHKIADKEFTLDDFSHEHLTEFIPGQYLNGWTLESNDLITLPNDLNYRYSSTGILRDIIIKALNFNRERYLQTKDKKYWWQIIQLLPSSYNQRRTVQLNYESAYNMYYARKNHKLDEWHVFCDYLKTLPYFKKICSEN